MLEGCNNEVNMEASNCQRLSESPVPEDESSDPGETTCRLRHTLNEDCILKVFEFLTVTDLLQMCKVHNYFKNVITKWVIGRKVLNLRGMDTRSKVDIFQTFETVRKYCEPARLTEVELNFKQTNIDIDINNVQLSMNYFSNLRKLKIHSLNYERIYWYRQFLTSIVDTALNLQVLYLNHIDIEGPWMRANRMDNLFEFQIHKPRTISFANLNTFLQSLPNLKTFIFNGTEDITAVGNTLSNYCPNLVTFQDIHTSNPYRHFSLGPMTRYNFLSTLSNLRFITLTSYTFCGSDLYYPLVKLAKQNIVKLTVVSDLEHSITFNGLDREHIMQSSFADFTTSLTELVVNIRNFRLSGELRCDFVLHFAKQLKNLHRFTLESDRLANSNKIIELLPNCRTFSISKIIVKHLPVEMRKIVRTLRTIRQINDFENYENLVTLIVNIEQWRELQVYKDVNSLMKLIIDHNVQPYHHGRRHPYY